MTEGFWVRPDGSFEQIDDHAAWLSRGKNAELLGLSPGLAQRVRQANWVYGRLQIVVPALMEGFTRVRWYSATEATFEYARSETETFPTVQKFLKHAQPGCLEGLLLFRNIRAGREWMINLSGFLAHMEKGNPGPLPVDARTIHPANLAEIREIMEQEDQRGKTIA